MKLGVLVGLALAAHSVAACRCTQRLTACHEAAASGTIFIGTVESITLGFLSRWSPLPRPSVAPLNAANEAYLAHPSPAALAALKDSFRTLFPDLPEDARARLDAAETHPALVAVLAAVLDRGQRVRLRVRERFSTGDQDDDKQPATLDVWTPTGDCGVDFQVGETYLVYAGDDEETNLLETNRCSRTRRLTDAGADLAYLFFYRDGKKGEARLEGFTTFDPLYQAHRAVGADPEKIDLPAAGVVVELRTAAGSRYTTSDANGRFVFDGVPAGEQRVAAYAAGFPETVKLLAGPKAVTIAAGGCASETLVIEREKP